MNTENVIKHVHQQVKNYLIVFGTLLILTVITVLLSRVQVQVALGVVLALIVAGIKGTLVAGIFMHMFSEKISVVNIVLIFSGIFFLVMIGLILFGYFDSFLMERAVVEFNHINGHH